MDALALVTGGLVSSGSGGSYPTTSEISAAVVSALAADTIEGSHTFYDALRILLSEAGRKGTVPAGAGSFAFRDGADSKNRIAGTVDANGNRTITTLDGT